MPLGANGCQFDTSTSNAPAKITTMTMEIFKENYKIRNKETHFVLHTNSMHSDRIDRSSNNNNNQYSIEYIKKIRIVTMMAKKYDSFSLQESLIYYIFCLITKW